MMSFPTSAWSPNNGKISGRLLLIIARAMNIYQQLGKTNSE